MSSSRSSVDTSQLEMKTLERELDAYQIARGEPAQRTIGFSVKGSQRSPSSPSSSAVVSSSPKGSPVLRVGSSGEPHDEVTVGTLPAPMYLPMQARPNEAGAGPIPASLSVSPTDVAVPERTFAPKKVLTKAETRELQERQRAAKAGVPATTKQAPSKQAAPKQAVSGGGGGGGGGGGAGGEAAPPPVAKQHDTADATKLRKQRLLERTNVQKAVALFAHLPQYEREKSISLPAQTASAIHPTVAKLGIQYAEGVIQGANARCVAMLNAFKEVIRDYRTPPAKALNRDLESRLRPQIQYLVDCRPVGINMGNAIKWLKARIAKLPPHLSELDAKETLCAEIDGFIAERITLASAAISALGASKVQEGDVIVTYGCAHVVEDILVSAHAAGVSFRVVVLDARPHWEGRVLWKRLVAAGLDVNYAGMHALSYSMRSATKVLMGAHACLSNGAVVSRAGSSLVALCATRASLPVLIACETYKFAERVMLDAICANELGDPDELVTVRPPRGSSISREQTATAEAAATGGAQPVVANAAALPGGAAPEGAGGSTNVLACLSDWRDVSTLRLLNLTYDVTPCELITMVISEVGMTPPTSIPVIIREYRQDTGAR